MTALVAATRTYSTAEYIADAVNTLRATIDGHEKSTDTMRSTVTYAFASLLASDEGMTAKVASKTLAEMAPGMTTDASRNAMRTHNVALFTDARVALLRHAVGEAKYFEPLDFAAAVRGWCEGVNARSEYDAGLKAAKAAAEAAKAAPKAVVTPATDGPEKDREPAAEPAAPVSRALTLQTQFGAILAELVAMANEGDADASEAVFAIYDQSGAIVTAWGEVASVAA